MIDPRGVPGLAVIERHEHLRAPHRDGRLFPDEAALVYGDYRVTYAELSGLSAAAAERLADSGVTRGDRVAIMLPNTPRFVVWYYATLRLGALPVSISSRFAAAEVLHVVGDSGAKAFVAAEEQMARVADALPDAGLHRFTASELGDAANGEPLDATGDPNAPYVDADPDEAAAILYTSGTTGFAKGATLSHRNVRTNADAFNHLCGMRPGERLLLAVPLFHCFGQNALMNSALHAGCKLVMQQSFDPHETRRLIREHRVTQVYGVPTMFRLLLDRCDAADLASVTYCFSAAAPLPEAVSRRWLEKFGQPIYEGYGLTETSPFASYNHRLRYTLGSIGTAIDGVEMKIVDSESGADCPPGELGEIAIRGPNVMLGYWNRPEETARAVRDGWFHSGDIGRMDADGFFYIVDRVKDMISVGGLKVYPAEVERVLAEHTSVAEAAVVGVPDEVFGEQVVAFVVPKAEEQDHAELLDQIDRLTRESLASYKTPKRLHFVDELPRNPSGKVLKTKLRELAAAAAPTEAAADGAAPPEPARLLLEGPPLRERLASAFPDDRPRVATQYLLDAIAALQPEAEPCEADSRVMDAGLDSLTLVELSNHVQAELGPGVEVPATLVFDHPRVADLAGYLLEHLAPTQAAVTPAVTAADTLATSESSAATDLLQEIGSMSEEEAARELLRELEETPVSLVTFRYL